MDLTPDDVREPNRLQLSIRETGDVIERPVVEIMMPMPRVLVDGRDMPVPEAISILLALRGYWRERARRFETQLADLRAGQPVEP